jgi:hypothetical protein
LVPDNLTLLGHNAPKKWEQHFPAFRGIVIPKLAAQLFGADPDTPVLLVQQIGIGTGEYFLPAHAIAHNEDDVSGLDLRPERLDAKPERHTHDDKNPQLVLQSPSLYQKLSRRPNCMTLNLVSVWVKFPSGRSIERAPIKSGWLEQVPQYRGAICTLLHPPQLLPFGFLDESTLSRRILPELGGWRWSGI